MGWGVLGDIANGAKDVAGGAADFVDDKAKDAGKAFDAAVDGAKDAVDTAGDVAKGVGRTVSNASISDIGHTALDVAGMVPVIGEAADLANAGWYLAEGDYTNAALSAASAIPIAGNAATAAKWSKRTVDSVDAARDGFKALDTAKSGARAAADAGARAVDKVKDVAGSAIDDIGRGFDNTFGPAFGVGGPSLAMAGGGRVSTRATGGAENVFAMSAKGSDNAAGASKSAADVRQQNIDKGIPENLLGPSGKPKRHNVDHASKKEAREASEAAGSKDASKAAGSDEPMHHPTPKKGKPHYHPTNADGSKQLPNVHHNYPGPR